MAIALDRAGHDFVIFERSTEVGGTWHDNIYPGAGCDVSSHLYCFSFEPNPDWQRKFALQPEIHQYFVHCVAKYRLAPRLRLGTEVTAIRFAETEHTWHLTTAGGEDHVFDAVVSGTGQLNRPHVAKLAGDETFAGTRFHSARWNPAHELAGRDVAVIGSGASAIQLVPQIAKVAKRVTVFQRTPPYVMRRNDHPYPAWQRWLFRHIPFLLAWTRTWLYWVHESRFPALRRDSWMGKLVGWLTLRHMRSVIRDPALRDKLTPAYPVGCKRILISDDWYQALTLPNVEVVTAGIERVTPGGITTADGASHAADTIIDATGFESTGFLVPIHVTGRGGAVLSEVWRTGAAAHHGITVAGFPNLFLLYGPNTNLGHNSILFMIECQVRYITRCLGEVERRGARWLEVRPEAMARSNERLQRALARTVWGAGCHNWYATDGKITNNWSGRTTAYWWRSRRPRFSEFEFAPRGSRAPVS